MSGALLDLRKAKFDKKTDLALYCKYAQIYWIFVKFQRLISAGNFDLAVFGSCFDAADFDLSIPKI